MQDPTPGRGASEPDSAYVFSYQIGFPLRRAYQRHLAIFQANTGNSELTSVQFSTLCALRVKGPHSQGGLVKVTGVDRATIRGVIERLKARRLVSLAKDAVDGRKVIVALTAAGAEMLDRMIPHANRTTGACQLTCRGRHAERLDRN
ncbi:MarR family winged helix-turn-helix transcriptional regulator [Bradyrhizobium sp. Bra78]|uniref:MarR family winged helix-turn-helix transcriptional regulator n=1 Tax=Bradyrhizobium sp. Bra78 TaxID=2926010 RepID=UPI0021C5E391|nr:MarR family winged helix-turn-helix transcriptional regulator [Bradyrhizobium sp. Bra78]